MSDYPTPIKRDSRICFAIDWFESEDDAELAHRIVTANGETYNGGHLDGMPCGRDRSWDYTDDRSGERRYAVTRS